MVVSDVTAVLTTRSPSPQPSSPGGSNGNNGGNGAMCTFGATLYHRLH